jgi:hypothetical protein
MAMAGPQHHDEEHNGPIEQLRLALNRFERYVLKVLQRAKYSISFTESDSICYGVEGEVWFWHLDYSDRDMIRLGREIEQSISRGDLKKQELIAVARIAQLLPGLWQELSQSRPTWEFAQRVSLLSSNVPYPGARKRLAKEIDNQKRSVGGQRTATLRKDAAANNRAALLVEATKLLAVGREPKDIVGLLKSKTGRSESTIRRALAIHDSGHWKKTKRKTATR